jgi:anti-sigma regulatory factor (Ser/Thr protein kinase)
MEQIRVRNDHDLIHLDRSLNTLTKGLDEKLREDICLAGSELGTNLVKCGGGGRIELERDGKFILRTFSSGKLKLEDFLDEVSSMGSLGIGLGMVGRLSDEFEYNLAPAELTWVKYLEQSKVKFKVAKRTCPFLQNGNGDAIVSVDKPGYAFFSLIDMAGHGKLAGETAKIVRKFVYQHHFLKLDDLLVALDGWLWKRRNEQELRVGVIALLRLWKAKKKAEFSAVGEINAKVFGEQKETLPTQGGFVGYKQLTGVKIHEFPRPKGMIALFSDGLSSRLSIEPAQMGMGLEELADELFEKYKKPDDRSLILISY